MINHLQKKSYLYLLHIPILLIYTAIFSKQSDAPEVKMHWSTSNNQTDHHRSHGFKNFLKNHVSYNIRPTQSLHNNKQHIHQNNYHNPYIAYMSVSDFQHIFASITNKNDILNNYALYAYPNFRSFARGLPYYKEFIIALHTKIQTDKNFKAHTIHAPGFNASEFHAFVRNEVNAIHQAQIASQKTTAEKKGALNISDAQKLNTLAHHCMQRINAASQKDITRLHDRLTAIEQTKKSNGPELDYQLHKELSHTRNTMYHLERTYSHDPHIQILAPVVYRYTTRAKHEHCPLVAFELSDFCHTITQVLENGMHILYDASSAIGKGVLKGAHDFASIEHWKDMATGVMQLGLLFADAVGQEDALHYAMVLAATSDNSDALTIAAEQYCSYTQAQKDAINLCAQETSKKLKAMSWQKILEHGTEIGTTMILDTLAFNALNGFGRTASNLAIKQLNNALENGTLLTEQYAVEVAGFGKLIVEEGAEITVAAADLIKNDLTFFKNESKCIAQLLHKWEACNFAPGKLETHFNKHVLKKAEWGKMSMSMDEYLNKAKYLLNSEISNCIEGFISKEGWIFKYNKTTNELAIAKPDGIIETLFRPTEGINYWIEQINKYK